MRIVLPAAALRRARRGQLLLGSSYCLTQTMFSFCELIAPWQLPDWTGIVVSNDESPVWQVLTTS